jgi:non-ribosomal peptide synthetase component F
MIHQLFEAQVARTPGAIALSCQDKNLTYGELNARANQLAAVLGERGVKPGVLVAVALGDPWNLLSRSWRFSRRVVPMRLWTQVTRSLVSSGCWKIQDHLC